MAPPTPPQSGVYPYPAYQAYPSYPMYQAPAAYPAAYAYPATPGYGYGAYGPGYMGYAGYMAPTWGAPKKRGASETYALVIAWIVTGLAGLSLLCGLLTSAIVLLEIIFTNVGDDLSILGGVLGFTLAPLVGGAFGLWYGIRGIMRRPSLSFKLPAAWIMLALTVVAIGGALVIWVVNERAGLGPGPALGVLPLVWLAGALPALTILAFTTQRLKDPASRRHVWMSLFYGMTLAPLIAVILETILTLLIITVLGLTGADALSVLNSNGGPSSFKVELATILVLSVVAPVVEEGVKPLGALLAIRRLRTPGQAFLVGLAGGIGFDIFETVGYIGQGQADWVSVALERIGAGLLHGVGAGMAALGWYYLVNGKGVRLRWLRAVGFFAYALLQHGLFNAFTQVSNILPPSINDFLNQPLSFFGLPLARMDIFLVVIYGFILAVLIVMTSRLPHAKPMPAPAQPPQWPANGYPYPYGYGQYGPAYPAIPWGYGLAQPPAPQGWSGAAGGSEAAGLPAQHTQPTGGAQ